MDNKINFKHVIKSSNDFKELGKIDQKSYQQFYENLTKIAIDNPGFKKAIELTTYLQQTKIKKLDTSKSIIEEYAAGLDVSSEQLYSAMLMPEIVTSFNKWIPNILGLIPGCSSLFIKDKESSGIIHSRILDYSIGTSLSSNERAIHVTNTGGYDIFGYTTAGFPIPSLSSINDQGLSLAIHYKHGNFFDIEGSSIFEIAYDLLAHCSNIAEVRTRLKDHKSISHWGFYLSDKYNNVASIDIRGFEINFESYHIDDYDYLYFNNKVMSNDNTIKLSQPFGHINQCSMRNSSYAKNYKMIKPDNMASALKSLLYIKEKKNKFDLSPLTIASVQAYAVNNKTFESQYIIGPAPKVDFLNTIKSENIFKSSFYKVDYLEKSNNFQRGQKHLSLTQSFIDIKDYESAYFHIQMAENLFKGRSEQYICTFYLNVLEYITLNSREDLYYVLKNFKFLKQDLPEYLSDHCILFELRLLKLLNEKYDINNLKDLIKNEQIKNILMQEHLLKPFALKMLKKLIYPRIEILDIIYAYS